MSNYSVIEVGSMGDWGESAKRFVEGDLGTQYIGMSVNATEPGGESPFWHSHSKIEEIYVVLDGVGEIALDNEVLPLTAGTVVRVGQGVSRALRALPDSPIPMKWLCLRAGGNTLEGTGNDAELDKDTPFPWSS